MIYYFNFKYKNKIPHNAEIMDEKKQKQWYLKTLLICKTYLSPFGAHDMIEIGYDMKMDKDRKWYRHDKHISYHMFDTHMW